MFYELLVFGTFWFWAVLAFEFCFLIYALGRENYGSCMVSVLLLLGGWLLFGDFRYVGSWIWHHPLQTLAWFGGYLVVGTIYAVSKWWLFVRDVRDENRDKKKEWLASWKTNASNLGDMIRSIQDQLQNARANDRIRCGEDYISIDEKPMIEAYVTTLQNQQQALLESNGIMTAALLPCWKEYEKKYYFSDWFGRSISISKPLPEDFKGRIISWIGYWPPSMFWTLLNDPLRRLGRQIYYGIANMLSNISNRAWRDEDNVADNA